MLPYRLAYRIEDKNYRGPWVDREGDGVYDFSGHEYYAGSMPSVGQDRRIRGRNAVYPDRFAFPSVAKLRAWFCPSTLGWLHERGFVCSLYATSWHGHTLYENQITFDYSSAIRLRSVPLHRLIGVPYVRATGVPSHAIL